MTAGPQPMLAPDTAAGATRLYSERLSALRPGAAELVLLSGWSMDSSVWRGLLPELRQRANVTLLDLPGTGRSESADWDREALMQALLAVAPAPALYLGWSLGGMLAWELARRVPERVRAIITLGSSPRLVAEDGWTAAMPAAEFRAFRQRVASLGSRALVGFDHLQAGDDPVLRDWCRRYRRGAPTPRGLGAALDLLSQLDLRESLPRLRMPVVHLLGERDRLVPARLGGVLEAIAPRQSVQVLAGLGHLLPLSAGRRLLAAVDGCLPAARPVPAPRREKSAVARSFDRAAGRYDRAATLQRRTGHALLARLPEQCSGRVLDLGCGTGHFRHPLQQKYPHSRYTGLDLSRGMVQFAAGRVAGSEVADWVVGDAEDLPLASHSVALVFSNLALQWCEQPRRLATELMRVLAPGGQALIATLGPATLHELRRAWSQVDEHEHVNRFAPLATLEAAFRAAGLHLQSVARRQLQMRYQHPMQLFRELKCLGAHNVNLARPPGLTGRRSLEAVSRAYESFREHGKLPASYEVYYLHLSRPQRS